MNGPYDDIIQMPHHVSANHPPMAAADRAAQFCPFAALSGYEAAITETERLTERRIEPDEDAKAILDGKLRMAAGRTQDCQELKVTYFIPDRAKAGGSYETAVGYIKKIDDFRRAVVMADGTEIAIDDIIEIEGVPFYSPD